jgi:hypothetical protein
LAAAQLAAAEDHILGLETLLLESETAVAPIAVARAAVEAAGRASLLLDPSLSHRQRAELAVSETLHELHWTRELMLAHGSDQDDEVTKADIHDIAKRIHETKAYLRKHTIKVPDRPVFTTVLEQVLAVGEDVGLGKHSAVLYSAFAHSVPHFLLTLTVGEKESAVHPMNVGLIELPDWLTLDLVFVVVHAHARGVSRQVEVYAWPPSSWARWRGHVRAVLRRAMRSGLQRPS